MSASAELKKLEDAVKVLSTKVGTLDTKVKALEEALPDEDVRQVLDSLKQRLGITDGP